MVDDLFLLGLRALGYAPRLLLASGDTRALTTLLDVAMVGVGWGSGYVGGCGGVRGVGVGGGGGVCPRCGPVSADPSRTGPYPRVLPSCPSSPAAPDLPGLLASTHHLLLLSPTPRLQVGCVMQHREANGSVLGFIARLTSSNTLGRCPPQVRGREAGGRGGGRGQGREAGGRAGRQGAGGGGGAGEGVAKVLQRGVAG